MLLNFGGNTVIAICLSMIDIEDEDKFNKFYKRYFKLVMFILNDILKNPSEVEDVASECFILFAKNFYKIKDVESKETESYVKIVTKHMGLKAYNKRKGLPDMVNIEDIDEEDPINYEERIIEKKNDEDVYSEVLNTLSDRYYDTKYLSIVLEFTPKEIGEILGINPDTIYKRLKKAKKLMRDYFDSREEE